MNVRTKAVIAVLSLLCLCPAPRAFAEKARNDHEAGETEESREKKFNLKPGALRTVCLTCHVEFEEKLKKPFVHTPVIKKGCPACHSPHTSNYPKQLAADVSRICLTCHEGILPKDPRSSHKVVVEGKCVQCHDPHSSENEKNLLRKGNQLCYGCHKLKMDAIAKVKFKHYPVENDCISCHNPHGSPTAAALLNDEVPALCGGCHQTDDPSFVQRHVNYPVGKSRCTICHSVHGSDRAGMIHNSVHPPFASKSCNFCHEGPGSQNPLNLKKNGFELCRGCHNTLINDMFTKNRLHLPVVGKKGCLNCHSPHASPERPLLNKPLLDLCGSCHADTIQRQANSITKHPPIAEGTCTACHTPHASDEALLFTMSSPIDLCRQCHDGSKHATHPIGPKFLDKRNKNLTMQCLSCHRAHGTEHQHMLPAATVSGLCTQCHVNYGR